MLPKDYLNINVDKVNVYLLDGSKNTLSSMSSLALSYSEEYLTQIGGIVKTNVIVTEYDGVNLTLNNGGKIPFQSVIWFAGITGNMLSDVLEDIIMRDNRVKVDRTIR